MRRGHLLPIVGLFIAALTLGACGSPTSPSSGGGVTVHGVALGTGASASSDGRFRAMSGHSGGSVTVTVQEDASIKVTVSAKGTFELEGLPAGTFTLVFSVDGTVIGTITVTSVPDGAEVNIVVQITTTTVIKIKIEINGQDEDENEDNKTCAINGGRVGEGIELEGSISSGSGSSFTMDVNGNRSSAPVTVDASGASFDCAGVKGTCDASLIQAGQKVHVSGTLTSCSLSAAAVKASEVKFQH